ncbi:MAG: GNAT family N-acetyltransferase [Capnocytophaga leadbetteri]|jgi:acetyltransferase, GNAT family|uniref:GNAT family N-acetyltransferase n=1 Tax=Capnocytophaga leadbetteri TaxID=327575 RepID=UPI0017BF14AA|nr:MULTISPECIES: GNAT family N-acetyltransferase [Capnocytophaga]MBB1569721.1 GNAT family N-acetyltransferase [Capnocytophaga sp.]
MLDKLSFLLLTDNHTIKPFDCEDDDLNDFLFNEAILYKEQMLATTFLIENEERTLGYYSILSDAFRVEEINFTSKSQYKKFVGELLPHPKRYLKNIPAVKIGRLGVDKMCKGKGLGSIMMHNIIVNCIKLNEQQACRIVTVDAYKQAQSFYERFGFKYFTHKDENQEVRQMFLDLSNVINIKA